MRLLVHSVPMLLDGQQLAALFTRLHERKVWTLASDRS